MCGASGSNSDVLMYSHGMSSESAVGISELPPANVVEMRIGRGEAGNLFLRLARHCLRNCAQAGFSMPNTVSYISWGKWNTRSMNCRNDRTSSCQDSLASSSSCSETMTEGIAFALGLPKPTLISDPELSDSDASPSEDTLSK